MWARPSSLPVVTYITASGDVVRAGCASGQMECNATQDPISAYRHLDLRLGLDRSVPAGSKEPKEAMHA